MACKYCFDTDALVGLGEKYRHAGFSSSRVEEIIPGELYAGRDALKENSP